MILIYIIGPYARVTRKFDHNGKVIGSKNADFPEYTDEDARLGRNASYESPYTNNNNEPVSSNIVLNHYLHAY